MTRETYSYGVDFFSDEMLECEVGRLVKHVRARHKSRDPHENIIDPFAAIFESAVLDEPMDQWFEKEVDRQNNKTLTNQIGAFHQTLLGELPGWESTGKSGGSWDLVHRQPFGELSLPVLAEVKNKFNTMSSETQKALFRKFESRLEIPDYKKFAGYLIQVIQKEPSGDVQFAPSGSSNRKIRMIGAQQVYETATGDPQSFRKMFEAVRAILGSKWTSLSDLESNEMVDELFERAYEPSTIE